MDAAEQPPPAVRATGGCLCGAVRYEVRGPLRDVVVCHCRQCRRFHGHVGAYAACAAEDLIVATSEALRAREDAGRTRTFCGACGTGLFWRAEGRDRVSIAAGTLDEPTGLRTIAHIFVGESGDYYEIGDEGDRHEGPLPA